MRAFLNINIYVATLLGLMLMSCANYDSGPVDGPDPQDYYSDAAGPSVVATGVWTLDGELVGNGVLQLGYTQVGVRKGYYEKPREDALIMQKKLV